MTAATLPRAAALYCGDGQPWYPAQADREATLEDHTIVWFARPEIPLGVPFHWVGPADVGATCIDLGDRTTLAELLYVSAVDPALIPDDIELCAAVLAQVDRCHCDLAEAIQCIAQDAGDHPATCAARMAWCLEQAERLLKTEA